VSRHRIKSDRRQRMEFRPSAKIRPNTPFDDGTKWSDRSGEIVD
jgi:hypothetical protein